MALSRAPSTPTAAPTVERLLALVDAMAGRPVVLLADLVVDRFIHGEPKRISREAPVLILRHENERIVPGGGANAVANVAALGGRPLPLGIVGDDENGRALLAELDRRGIDTGAVRVRSGYRTPTKTRILGGVKGTTKQQIVRYDIEDVAVPADEDRSAFQDAVATFLGATAADPDDAPRVAVVSDYGYGIADAATVAAVRDALAHGADETVPPLLLGDSRFGLDAVTGLDAATPNEEETEALLGAELPADPEAAHGPGVDLARRLGVASLLVTRGSRGMALFRPGAPSAHLPVHGGTQVTDVTGAGDTVIGTFALALAAGADPLEAAVLADYAGGIVVMKAGTATLDRDELAAAVRSDRRPVDGLRWAGTEPSASADPGSSP